MLQRAGLAQALVADPRLVVQDEPMSGLDPLGRALVRDLILEERKAGRTVFFSSHILSDIEALCDRVAVLVGGKLRGQGTVSELLGTTTAAVDCTFEVAGDAPGEVRRRDGDRVEVRLAPEHVDAACDEVRRRGGRILAVTPRTRTLEDVLLDEIERTRQVDPKRLGVLA
jgi:ABC-2 type transport system ATP-binding protein